MTLPFFGHAAPVVSGISDGISLQNASVTLQTKPVLHDITLHLGQERIAIIGRNGSGKTSLLRLIAGLIAPTAGTVRVEGHDPFRDRKAMLRHLGILFQSPDHQILFPTPVEELSFGLVQQGSPKAKAQAIARAHLTKHSRADWADAPITALSQGQRQWLCLQAVLLMQPRTILLDEPLSGLDLPTQMRLMRSFDALTQRLITITHDPAHAARAERVIWIDRGTVHADGTPEQVIPAYSAAMTAEGVRDADAIITV